MLKRYVAPFGLLVLSGFLASAPASAAYLAFVEQGDSTTVVYDNFFECGIDAFASGETAQVNACWFTNSQPGYAGDATMYMIEPASSPDAGAISDEIHVQFSVDGGGNAHISMDFLSDTEGAPLRFPAPGLPVLIEDGTNQLVLDYFFDTATGAPIQLPANLELRVQSDVEGPVPTKPTTWGTLKARY